jgi:small GTP-binding protein
LTGKKEIIKKVCVLGDPGVGKTSIINRYVKNVFSPEYLSTIGANISTKELELEPGKLIFSIWDIAGQQTSRSLGTSHYKGSEGVIYVYDLSSQDSYDGLINWEYQLKKSVEDAPHLILGNKLDLIEENEIPEKRLPVGFKFKSNFFMVSAKTSEGIEDAFKYLGEQILKKMQGNK